MSHQALDRIERGQGMVEYALILALVAVVAIAGLSLVGLGVQRNLAVIAGVMGADHDTSDRAILEITTAQCIAVGSSGLTGLWVVGVTDQDIAWLSASNEYGINVGVDGLAAAVSASGPNTFQYNPLLAYSADISACPKTIVIQSASGAIAVAPVDVVVMP